MTRLLSCSRSQSRSQSLSVFLTLRYLTLRYFTLRYRTFTLRVARVAPHYKVVAITRSLCQSLHAFATKHSLFIHCIPSLYLARGLDFDEYVGDIEVRDALLRMTFLSSTHFLFISFLALLYQGSRFRRVRR
jgi:hypothetical protein